MQVLLSLLFVSGVVVRGVNSCNSITKCGECVQDPNCAWCAKENYTRPRCDVHKQSSSWCAGEIINPGSYKDNETIDNKFNDGKNKEDIVQFRPQKLKIFARPQKPVKFEFQYKPAEQYPLDLYYLADYSYSMGPYKRKLVKQGEVLYTELRKMTDNVVMGIGSFVDKSALPYSSVYKDSYVFKNHLSLTKNIAEFSKKVNNSALGGNLDNPEATLDALLQVMVCSTEIGWRTNTTRLIVVTTDGPYHSAGDGKMIGIIQPHDGKCHLTKEKGEYAYDKSLDLDYPSISLINEMAQENNFVIIFAAPEKVGSQFKALARAIPGSKYAVLGEPKTVVNLIRTEYQKMLQSFNIMAQNLPSNVKLSFNPDCTKEVVPMACKITNNGQVNVTATLEVVDCPKETSSLIQIRRSGNPESLTIDLRYICDCSLSASKFPRVNASEKCNTHGDYQYGSCYCHSDWYGENCQCSGKELDMLNNKYSDKCKSENGEMCMGRGKCVCGICSCDSGYSGTYCECNNESCAPPYPGGPICSGRKNGKCNCGKCECTSDFEGLDCSCTTKKDDCIDVFSDKVCSGNGHCKCGKCVCQNKPVEFYGPFCEQCRGCPEPEGRCEKLHDCVDCYINNRQNCNCKFGTPLVVERFEDMSQEMAEEWKNSYICRTMEAGASCNILFKYKFSEKRMQVDILIQKALDCSKQNEVLMYIGGLVATLVLVPLLTLLAWKLITHLYDQREYMLFKKELDMGEWAPGENPLYDTPTTTINNPAYNKDS